MVATHADVATGPDDGAVLADQDRTGQDRLTITPLHAEALTG